MIIQEKNIKDLNKVGKVMPRIKQSVVIKRYTTIYPLDMYQYMTIYPLDMYQYMTLEEPFEAIIKEIKKKK